MNEYRGFQEIRNDDVRLPEFYGNMGQNIFGCLENEYVLIDDGDVMLLTIIAGMERSMCLLGIG